MIENFVRLTNGEACNTANPSLSSFSTDNASEYPRRLRNGSLNLIRRQVASIIVRTPHATSCPIRRPPISVFCPGLHRRCGSEFVVPGDLRSDGYVSNGATLSSGCYTHHHHRRLPIPQVGSAYLAHHDMGA